MRKTILGISTLILFAAVLFTACSKDEENAPENIVINGHEAVDLGLPSGTKWATVNIGASRAEDRGDFFQWGEIKTCTDKSENVAWNDHYAPNGQSVATAVTCGTDKDPLYSDGVIISNGAGTWIGSIAGNAKYDAARDKWGDSWMMPTEAQIKELITSCSWKQTTVNGVEGYKVSGKNGNSIFLPLGGYRQYASLDRGSSAGCFWSATINAAKPSNANYLIVELNAKPEVGVMTQTERYFGFNIRAVHE